VPCWQSMSISRWQPLFLFRPALLHADSMPSSVWHWSVPYTRRVSCQRAAGVGGDNSALIFSSDITQVEVGLLCVLNPTSESGVLSSTTNQNDSYHPLTSVVTFIASPLPHRQYILLQPHSSLLPQPHSSHSPALVQSQNHSPTPSTFSHSSDTLPPDLPCH
jgi:hypothetical protein